MPSREKSAWISALSMMAIYGFYFWSLVSSGSAPEASGLQHVPLLVGTIVVLVVVRVEVAMHAPNEARAPRDEREKLIELKATRRVLRLGVGRRARLFLGALNPPILFGASGLLFVPVTAEFLRAASQVIYNRQGA